MNARNEREVARHLADMPSAEPPAELLARIKADIPEELPVPGTRAPGSESNVVPFRLPRTWLAAAAVVVMLGGGGLLTWRLTQVVDSPEMAMEMSDPVAQQEAVSEAAPAVPERRLGDEARDETTLGAGEAEGGERRRLDEPADPPRRTEGALSERQQEQPLGGDAESDRVANEPAAVFYDSPDTLPEANANARDLDEQEQPPIARGFESSLQMAPPPPPPPRSQRAIPKPQTAAPAGPTPEELNRAVAERRRQVAIPDPTPDEPEAAATDDLEYSDGFAEEIMVSGSAPIIDTTSTTGGATFGQGDDSVPTRWHPSGRSARRSQAKAKEEPDADAARQIEEPVEEIEVEAGGLTAEFGFRDWGVSPFVDSSEDRLSTFGLDVDTGAYTVLRRYVDDGRLPPPAAVRVEEIVNWFTYSDPFAERPARAGETFRVIADGAPSPVGPGAGHRLLRFQVAARPVAEADRKPAVLTLVVDNSGSMEGENLELVRAGLRRLVDNLNPGDRVALVGFSDDAWVVASHGDRKALSNGIEAMEATNGTNAEAGLKLGYELAEESFRDGCSNRVILLSDGVANVGATGPEAILARIGHAANRGIELTTVGVGMNYNDEMLEQLADRGDGRYAYVDRPEESERLFVEELTGTLETVAEEARVQVEFDARSVVRWRLLGYENRDIADERFRHDHSVDAGEVGAGQQVTALYEIELADDAVAAELPADRPLAEIKLRWREPFGGEFQESSQRLLAGDLASSWGGASRDLRLAAVAAELAEVLRDSPHARGMGLRQLVGPTKAVAAEFPGDAKVAELAALVEQAAAVAGK